MIPLCLTKSDGMRRPSPYLWRGTICSSHFASACLLHILFLLHGKSTGRTISKTKCFFLAKLGLPDCLASVQLSWLAMQVVAFLTHVEAVKRGQAILTEYESSWPLSEV